MNDPANDYVSVDIRNTDNGRSTLRAVVGNRVRRWRWPDDGAMVEEDVPIDDVLKQALRFMVYKGATGVWTDSLWEAVDFSFFFAMSRYHRRQRKYDRSILEYRGRMDALTAAVRLHEQTHQRGAIQVQPIGVGAISKELYGAMIASSDRVHDVHVNVGFKLASFFDSGELTSAERVPFVNAVTITPKAYATLSVYAADERRHEDSVRVQFWMVVATFTLALVAVLQLIATVK